MSNEIYCVRQRCLMLVSLFYYVSAVVLVLGCQLDTCNYSMAFDKRHTLGYIDCK